MTDEQIDAIAGAMPGGVDGFCKGWGYRQFARAVLDAADKDYKAQQERFEFAIAMCRDAQRRASCYGGALLTISTPPVQEQDNMLSANMREIARRALVEATS